MAAERLDIFLSEVIAEISPEDPDYSYLQGLKNHNTLYVESASRQAQVHDTESRRLSERKTQERKLLIAGVLGTVVDIFDVSEENIFNGRKTPYTVQARIAVSYLYHKLGDLRITEIAQRMNNHHTTIMHHLNRADVLMDKDLFFKESILEAESRLRQQASVSNPQA